LGGQKPAQLPETGLQRHDESRLRARPRALISLRQFHRVRSKPPGGIGARA
jgi:hypothetical protein